MCVQHPDVVEEIHITHTHVYPPTIATSIIMKDTATIATATSLHMNTTSSQPKPYRNAHQ